MSYGTYNTNTIFSVLYRSHNVAAKCKPISVAHTKFYLTLSIEPLKKTSSHKIRFDIEHFKT